MVALSERSIAERWIGVSVEPGIAKANPVRRGPVVLAGVFPPVVGSEWVTGPAEILVHILLNGLHEPITVAGATYNGVMPAWRDVLKDQEIAAVASYIRQWAPNASPPVESDLVSKLREATATRTTPWTATELKANPRGIGP
jgi:hypothetical protein